MDFGIIARPDAVAVPDAIRHPVEAVGQTPLRGAEIPADVRGEGFRSLPVPDAVEADEGVGDGVFPDVRGQAGGPLGETPLASPGEAGGEGRGDGLPQRPQAGGSRVAPPGLLDVGRVIRRAPPRRCPRRGVWAEVAAVRSRRRLGFSEELLAILSRRFLIVDAPTTAPRRGPAARTDPRGTTRRPSPPSRRCRCKGPSAG